MDNPKSPKPDELLDDLESIRQLLEQHDDEPPLLTDELDPAQIPLLSDVVEPGPAVSDTASPAAPESLLAASADRVRAAALQRSLQSPNARELARMDGELRAAAHLLLQDVIDDFVPQIEAELRRRLSARLDGLLVRQRR
jgi:hypothetical protein